MNIRTLHHYYRYFSYIKAWYFLIPIVIFSITLVYGLRNNYSTMVKLREAVYTTDQQGGDVEAALTALRMHVHGHMNTNLVSGNNAIRPPIQLKARYERLLAAEGERIKAQNAEVSRQADATCAAQFPAGGLNAPRVECIQAYVGANAVNEQAAIPDALYKFDFVSPKWSPDVAGISIVLTAIFTILFIARQLLDYYLRRKFS